MRALLRLEVRDRTIDKIIIQVNANRNLCIGRFSSTSGIRCNCWLKPLPSLLNKIAGFMILWSIFESVKSKSYRFVGKSRKSFIADDGESENVPRCNH